MKNILITGANRGIGLELARQCATRGDRIFAGCRTPEKAIELQALAINFPGQISIITLEVTDEASIAAGAELVADQSKGLDILINNAAINLGDEQLSTANAKGLLKTLHVNAVGPVIVVQKFAHLLKKGTDPKIVNVSSESGSIANMTQFRGYAYYGSKATENMYSRALAWDPETEGITVIAIHPGWVRTDMGGPDAHLSSEQSAAGILAVTAALKSADNGKFFTWEGDEYPW
jgi:NAD(P)-dependent dehydrogenase (short-subunit alcohol dehydrogenase family)